MRHRRCSAGPSKSNGESCAISIVRASFVEALGCVLKTSVILIVSGECDEDRNRRQPLPLRPQSLQREDDLLRALEGERPE